MAKLYLFILNLLIILSSCTSSKKLQTPSSFSFTNIDSITLGGHLGIYIYDITNNKPIETYNQNKYFVPASNTKLLTCYAALKFLPDSIETFSYYTPNAETIEIQPAGDPSFLNPEFVSQQAFELLKNYKNIIIHAPQQKFNYYGRGWAWDDYDALYSTGRSVMPLYNNQITLSWLNPNSITVTPNYFKSYIKTNELSYDSGFNYSRNFSSNEITLTQGKDKQAELPIYNDVITLMGLLKDTLHSRISLTEKPLTNLALKHMNNVATDSVLRILMHRSDNFYAEQTLLMVANKINGNLNDRQVMDSVIKTLNFTLKPKWVDGSGLSRYNMNTPKNFVDMLVIMKDQFGMPRLQNIFAGANEGTLENYYKALSGKLFAKTGTLSNQLALSGFLTTKSNNLLAFSILVNNHNNSAPMVRRAVEKYLMEVYEKN